MKDDTVLREDKFKMVVHCVIYINKCINNELEHTNFNFYKGEITKNIFKKLMNVKESNLCR